MDNLAKEQIEKTISHIREFKQLIVEKGSKEETVNYLLQETGLAEDECEFAYDFYDGIKLPS